ncbi:hypothetical protein [Vibrio ponticus]|nr:hypothetical protein [Vibrio ponticus]
MGTKKLYLLSEDACGFLDEAEKGLAQVIESHGKDNLMVALAQAGVIDGLAEVNPASFLFGEDRDEYERVKAWLDNIETHYLEFREKNLHDTYANRIKWAKIKLPYETTHRDLVDKGRNAAVGAGYLWDSGRLYSPREAKIKKYIAQYKEAKKAFYDNREVTPQEQVEKLKQRIDVIKALIQTTFRAYHIKDAAEYHLQDKQQELAEKEPQLNKLLESIKYLAIAGVATPEYALGQIEGEDGHALLAEYHQYLIDAEKFNQHLRDRLMSLSRSSDHYSIPPQDILSEEYEQIRQLRRQAKKLHQSAQVVVLEMDNPCFLLWNTGDYKAKPDDRVYTAKFPLREYVRGEENPKFSLGKFAGLRYFSLTYLGVPKDSDSHLQPNWSPLKDPDEAFYAAMHQYVDVIPVEDTWFSENGLLNYDNLKKALANRGIHIESLGEDYSQAPQWQETLENILYSEELEKRIEPFDSSLQAQFFRFAAMEVSAAAEYSEKTEFAIDLLPGENGKRESQGVQERKIELKAEAVLAKGEINIIEMATGRKYLYYPAASDLEPDLEIPIRYFDNSQRQETNFCFGALQTRMGVKAYGFAGANFSLAGAVTKDGVGFKLPELYETSAISDNVNVGAGDNASEGQGLFPSFIEMKAEAHLGVEISCYIDWHLPSGDYTIPEYVLEEQSGPVTLVKIAGKAEIAKEIHAPVYLRVKDKKVRIGIQVNNGAVKFTVEGDINPDALSAWVWQFQRLLRKCNYRRMEIVDNETFEMMSKFSRCMLYAQVEIGVFLATWKDALDNVLSIFDTDRAGMVAYTLYTGQEKYLMEWIRYMPPEGLGPLIGTLLEDPKSTKIAKDRGTPIEYTRDEILAMQQIALAKIFKWLATDLDRRTIERLVEEAFARTTNHPYLIFKEWRLLEFVRVRDKISEFLNVKCDLDMSTNLGRDWSDSLMYFKRNFDAVTHQLYEKVSNDEAMYKQDLLLKTQTDITQGWRVQP